jgi:transposase
LNQDHPVEGLFPPQDAQRAQVVEQIHHPPEEFGANRSRWTLALLQVLCPYLSGLKTLSGVWRRLRLWGIRRKRGRQHVTSPDPQYSQKLEAIEEVIAQARQNPQETVLLYSDETTLYRQPPVGLAYHEQRGGGKHQPRALRSYKSNTKHRVVAALDAVLGCVLFAQGYKIGVKALCRFLEQVRLAYGETIRIVLVWDNWPVHSHPEVLKAAQRYGIELLFLPTYAPWTNPVEKVWLKLKEEVIRYCQLNEPLA